MSRLLLFLFAIGTADAVFCQSLGEVAKKEKTRRQTNADEGKKAVVEVEGTGDSVAPVDSEGGVPDDADTISEPTDGGGSSELEAMRQNKKRAQQERDAQERAQASQYESELHSLRSRFEGCYPRSMYGTRYCSDNEVRQIQDAYSGVYQKLKRLDPRRMASSGLPSRLKR
jgi:hypothetical protein